MLTRVHRCNAVGNSEDSFMHWLSDVATSMKNTGLCAVACEKLLARLSSGRAESQEFQIIFKAISMHGVPAACMIACIIAGMFQHDDGACIMHAS